MHIDYFLNLDDYTRYALADNDHFAPTEHSIGINCHASHQMKVDSVGNNIYVPTDVIKKYSQDNLRQQSTNHQQHKTANKSINYWMLLNMRHQVKIVLYIY